MKKIKFARVGGLSPVIQNGYTLNPEKRTFHTPPARKGFYAFTYPYIEPFLLGGDWGKLGNKNKHEKFEYVKDAEGNRIKLYTKDWDGTENFGDIDKYINPELKKYMVKGKCGKWSRNEFGTDLSSKFWTEQIRDKDNNFINYYLIHKKKLKVFEHTGELWHHLKNDAVKEFEIIDEVGSWIKTDYDTFVNALEKDKFESVKQLRRDNFMSFEQEQINTRNVYNYMSRDHLEVFIERTK